MLTNLVIMNPANQERRGVRTLDVVGTLAPISHLMMSLPWPMIRHPYGVRGFFHHLPGVSATLQPPANFLQPGGLLSE